MIDFPLYLYAFLPALGLALMTWLLSVPIKDVSIVDSAWSLLFLAISVFLFVQTPTHDARTLLIMALITLWAMRLFIHLTIRNWGEPEDRRYVAIRHDYSPHFAFKSLFIIFVFQSVLAWIIALPLWPAITQHTPFGIWDIIAGVLFAVGFIVETVADWQLSRFKADANNEGKVMDQGLWRFTRHPNYFGECLIWWGFYCFAVNVGGYYTIVGPLLLTWLLLKFSGVVMLEATIVHRRPAYQDYINRTNAFIPGKPKQMPNGKQP